MNTLPLNSEKFELHHVAGIPVLSQRRQVIEEALAEDAAAEAEARRAVLHAADRAFDHNVSTGAHLYGLRFALDRCDSGSMAGAALDVQTHAVRMGDLNQAELVAAYENLLKRFNKLWNDADKFARDAKIQQEATYTHIKKIITVAGNGAIPAAFEPRGSSDHNGQEKPSSGRSASMRGT